MVISREDANGRINIGSGNETFFAAGSGRQCFSFELTIRTKFTVDPGILQKAVRKATERYWNYRLRPMVDKSGRLYFVNNTAEPKVFRNEGQRFELGTEEVAGYLFVTLYTDDSITVRSFHGIADAHGGFSFIKTVFYYYLTLSGNSGIKHDDVLTDEIPEDESERVCEYETFGNPDADPYYNIICDNAYCVDEDMAPLGEGRTIINDVTFSLPDVLARVKKNKLTITPWLGAVIGRAVYETYDVPDDRTVVSTCPIDGRKLFGVKALTSFGTTVKLPYDRKLNDLDTDTAAKIQRALLDLQNTRPFFEKEYSETMAGTKMLIDSVGPIKNIASDKFTSALQNVPVKSTFTLTNVGSLEFNADMERFVDDVYFTSVCRTGEVVCIITSYGDKLRIRVTQCFERDAFAKKIAEVLGREGIEATVVRGPDYFADKLLYEFPEDKSMKNKELTDPVQVTGGQIRGYREEEIDIYKGIPYAAPPVGELRWRPPQPVKGWDGVKDCFDWSASPIQMPQMPVLMWTREFIIEDTGYSEDCLYLNVWAPKDRSTKKPVIIFFHGGNLVSGGPSCEIYGGSELAKKGVVYVSAGFRVGILGLLASSELSKESENGVSGNYMVLDQIAVLKWVRDNIAAFGGDPDNVTISGLSAGSDNVNALSVSPLAKGLFRRAMAMSYTNCGYVEKLRPWGTLEAQAAEGDKLFAGRSLEEMRALPAEEFLKMNYPCKMCVDGYVLDKPFTEAVEAGESDDVEYMAGMVANEGVAFQVAPFGIKLDVEGARGYIRGFFGDLSDEVEKLYPINEKMPLITICDIGRDGFENSLYKFAGKRLERGAAKTYIYKFSHVMPGNNPEIFGAFHSSDMPYFWNILTADRDPFWTDTDRRLGEELSDVLVNFASAGLTDPEGSWKPYDGSGVWDIGSDGSGISKLEKAKNDLFDKFSK